MTYSIDAAWIPAQPQGPNPTMRSGWQARYRLPGDGQWRKVDSGAPAGLYTSEDYAYRVAGSALCQALNDRQTPPREKEPHEARPLVYLANGEELEEGFSMEVNGETYRLHEADWSRVYVRRRLQTGEWGRVLKRRPATLGLTIRAIVPSAKREG